MICVFNSPPIQLGPTLGTVTVFITGPQATAAAEVANEIKWLYLN